MKDDREETEEVEREELKKDDCKTDKNLPNPDSVSFQTNKLITVNYQLPTTN
jgi:hypothetical protein